MAKLYKFKGDTIINLCQHNAKVTREYESDMSLPSLINLSHTWESLLEMYKELYNNSNKAQVRFIILDNDRLVLNFDENFTYKIINQLNFFYQKFIGCK